MRTPVARVASVAVALLLAACEPLPTAPEAPAPSNPYDPLFGDRRIPTAVTGLSLAASSPTSVTLAWEDPSTFEQGFRVLRSEAGPNGYSDFEVIRVMGPDVTTFTDTLLTDVPRRYAVIPFTWREEGDISNVLAVRYPATVVHVTTGSPLRQSADRRVLAFNRGWSTGIVDAATLSETAVIDNGNNIQRSLSLSPSGDLLAVGDDVAYFSGASVRRSARIYRTSDGALVRELRVEGDYPIFPNTYVAADLAFSADAARLATVGDYVGVRVWDVATGTLTRTFGETEIGLYGRSAWRRVFFLPGMGQLLTVQPVVGAGILLWDPSTGALLRSYTAVPPNRIKAIRLSDDGRHLVAALWDEIPWGDSVLEFALLDLATDTRIAMAELRGPGARSDVDGLVLNPAGERLAVSLSGSSGMGERILIYDLRTGALERTLTPRGVEGSGGFGDVWWGDDGRTLLAVYGHQASPSPLASVWRLDDAWVVDDRAP